jgi:hypothetical protein
VNFMVMKIDKAIENIREVLVETAGDIRYQHESHKAALKKAQRNFRRNPVVLEQAANDLELRLDEGRKGAVEDSYAGTRAALTHYGIELPERYNGLGRQGEGVFNGDLRQFLNKYGEVVSNAWHQSEFDAKSRSVLSRFRRDHPVAYGIATVAAGATAAAALTALGTKVIWPMIEFHNSGFGKPLGDFVSSPIETLSYYWDRVGWQIGSSVDTSGPIVDLMAPVGFGVGTLGFTWGAYKAANRRLAKARERGFGFEVENQSGRFAEDIVNGNMSYEMIRG